MSAVNDNDKKHGQQMDYQYIIRIRNNGIRISLFSTFALIAVFTLYGYLVNPTNLAFSSKVIQLISELGMAVLLLLVGGLFTIGYGIYRICMAEKMKIRLLDNNSKFIKNKKSTTDRDITKYLTIIIDILSHKKYFRFFILILIVYAMIFSFVSQMIVFRPDVSFSRAYGVTIPSWKITPCCNSPGIVPFFTAYLSDNLIIFIIPINLILDIVISTLVGVNMTLVLYAIQNNNRRSKGTNDTSLRATRFAGAGGATAGLFTACPICAGTLFSTIVGILAGGTTGITASLTVTATSVLQPFQILFIIASLSILLLSSYLTVRRIKNTYSFSNIL